MSYSDGSGNEKLLEELGAVLFQWAYDVARAFEQGLHDAFALNSEHSHARQRLELTIFCMFSVDALTERLLQHWENGLFSVSEVDKVRESMRYRLMEAVTTNPELSRSWPNERSDLERLLRHRFNRYGDALERLRSDSGQQDLSAGTNELGIEAYRCLTGDEDVDFDIAMVLLAGFAKITERLAPLLKIPAAAFSEATSSGTLAPEEKKAMLAFRLRRFQQKKGHTDGFKEVAESYMSEQASKAELPRCSACDRLLYRRGTGRVWSWEWWWADYLSGQGTCGDCTSTMRRAAVLSVLILVTGYWLIRLF